MCKIPENSQYFKLEKINDGSKVFIELPHTILVYKVNEIDGWFLSNCDSSSINDEIFKVLKINLPTNFVKNFEGKKIDESIGKRGGFK